MGIAAVGNNLITYLINEMHFSLSKSANIVTNFVGTVFILALLGGYLSDSYLGCFWTMLIFGFVELSVLHIFVSSPPLFFLNFFLPLFIHSLLFDNCWSLLLLMSLSTYTIIGFGIHSQNPFFVWYKIVYVLFHVKKNQ